MIDQHQALSEAIRTAIALRHRELLLNGYESLGRLSKWIDDGECREASKVAVGQDWISSASLSGLAPASGADEVHDLLCELCGTEIQDMLVVSVIPGFDAEQRRQWAVTYSMRYADSMYSVSAKLSQWEEPMVRIFGWPYAYPGSEECEGDIEELAEEIRDEAIQKLQHVIYEQITKMHERHISCGYRRQKEAYQRFLGASANQGYLVSGSERFQSISTEARFGDSVDPEHTEAAFRDTWTLPMSQIDLLTAEYFPTEEGLDRWYVVYQMRALQITLNIFVKFYPHRRPQVEIVSS
jgi:hypothetical protein